MKNYLLLIVCALYFVSNTVIGMSAPWHPLLQAACAGKKEIALIWASPSTVDIRDEVSGETALIVASRNGHEEVVRILLVNGANPNLVGTSGQTALYCARKYPKIFKMLLENQADSNIQDNFSGSTLLMDEVSSGLSCSKRSYYIALLVKYGARLNIVDKDGKTAVTRAGTDSFIVKILKDETEREKVIIEFEKKFAQL